MYEKYLHNGKLGTDTIIIYIPRDSQHVILLVCNIVNICDDMPLEKINIRLCKYLLGVGKKTTNNAVRGELGRFPLAIRIITQFIAYWNRMQEIDYSSLAKTTYMHFLTEKRFPWFENIRNMMFFLELDNEWYKHIDYVLNDLHF